MSTLAIIPARGGSKGIPRKNLRPVAGRPLLAHVLGEALAAARVDRVVVSTEDAEIASVARALGAEVIARPPDLAGDETSSEAVLLDVLDQLREGERYEPEILVFLQATSPLTLAADIDGTVDALLAAGADSAFAAVRFFGFLWRRGAGGAAEAINHEAHRRPRRQEREGQFLEAGAVYAMRTEGFRRHRHRFFGKTVLHEIPPGRLLEIDEPHDLLLAESLLAARSRGRGRTALPRRVRALAMDFDGVLTDNRVTVFADGGEAVRCDRGDGLGLELLRERGFPMVVLSREAHPVVAARCRKLGIEVHQGLLEKTALLDGWLAARAVDPADAVYVGNDVNDLGCMARVGCPVAVADAHPAVLSAARLVLDRPGGAGAVRELVDLILAALDEDDPGEGAT